MYLNDCLRVSFATFLVSQTVDIFKNSPASNVKENSHSFLWFSFTKWKTENMETVQFIIQLVCSKKWIIGWEFQVLDIEHITRIDEGPWRNSWERKWKESSLQQTVKSWIWGTCSTHPITQHIFINLAVLFKVTVHVFRLGLYDQKHCLQEKTSLLPQKWYFMYKKGLEISIYSLPQEKELNFFSILFLLGRS